MTELDRALIRRKLARIVRDLEDLAQIEGLSLEAFRSDRFRQKGTERLLQEVVEAPVDIIHLLRVRGNAAPDDYFRTFTRLGETGDLPRDLAQALAPSAGLRSRRVHAYDAIDDRTVLEAVGEARRSFGRYVEAVEVRISEG